MEESGASLDEQFNTSLSSPIIDEELLESGEEPEKLADLASSYVSRQVMFHTTLSLTSAQMDQIFRLIHRLAEEKSTCLTHFIREYNAQLQANEGDITERNHGPIIWLMTELLKMYAEPVDTVILSLMLLETLVSIEGNSKYIVDNQTAGVVLGTMAAQSDLRDVQLYGSLILSTLSKHLPDKHGKARIREAAVEILLLSLVNFNNDIEVLTPIIVAIVSAAFTLRNIELDMERSTDNRRLHRDALHFMKLKCTSVILDLKERFSDCDIVQSESQRFLDLMSQIEDHSDDNAAEEPQNGEGEEEERIRSEASCQTEMDDSANTELMMELAEAQTDTKIPSDSVAEDKPVKAFGPLEGQGIVVKVFSYVPPDDRIVDSAPQSVEHNDVEKMTNVKKNFAITADDCLSIEYPSQSENFTNIESSNSLSPDTVLASDDDKIDAISPSSVIPCAVEDSDSCAIVEIDQSSSAISAEGKTFVISHKDMVDDDEDNRVVEVPQSSLCTNNLDVDLTSKELNDGCPVLSENGTSKLHEQDETLDRGIAVNTSDKQVVDSNVGANERDKNGTDIVPNHDEAQEIPVNSCVLNMIAVPEEPHPVTDLEDIHTVIHGGEASSHTSVPIDNVSDSNRSHDAINDVIITADSFSDSVETIVDSNQSYVESAASNSDGMKSATGPDQFSPGDPIEKSRNTALQSNLNTNAVESANLGLDLKSGASSDHNIKAGNTPSDLLSPVSPVSSSDKTPSVDLDCTRLQLRRTTYSVANPSFRSPTHAISPDSMDTTSACTTGSPCCKSNDLKILSDFEERKSDCDGDSINDGVSLDEDSYSLSDCCSENEDTLGDLQVVRRSSSCPRLNKYYDSLDEADGDDEISEDSLHEDRRRERRGWGSIHPPDVEGLLSNRSPSMIEDHIEDAHKVRRLHVPLSQSEPNICCILERRGWDPMPLKELLYLEEKSLESRSEVSSGSMLSQCSEADEDGILDYLVSQPHGYIVQILICRTQVLLYVLSYWRRNRYLTVFNILGRPVLRVMEDVRLPAETADFARSRQAETVHSTFVSILNQSTQLDNMTEKMKQKLLVSSEKLLCQSLGPTLTIKVCVSVEELLKRWQNPDKKWISSLISVINRLQKDEELDDVVQSHISSLLTTIEQQCEK